VSLEQRRERRDGRIRWDEITPRSTTGQRILSQVARPYPGQTGDTLALNNTADAASVVCR
jgi:hypothetical protein